MSVAAAGGHLGVVKWLHYNRQEGCTAAFAARNGQLEVVKWLSANRFEGCTVAAMDDAAAYGHLDVMNGFTSTETKGVQ
ncbi:hypothetical protein L917_00520 [Phytophthora nicotianae]|uniref:Uncharacterized protein n=2 Tax=Phytophthora nicotianae TaxID=4792 RepID=V9G151_PHYNI|nr:hypothetical protein F443_00585 [Phytophthora nicotianae P1569]ETI57061.1 hypothetical protein F443_00579 [Phytophthora nicotianae P1569]ETM03238.1 hypothetical protein L917_00520 [Phytophthora nicotianae]ETM56505.1 hypothetical protein L914_00539 [Phytophthora nicotianae]